MSDERYMTMSEACSFLHICKNTMKNWERKGRISCMRTEGGHRRYLRSDLIGLDEAKTNYKLPRKMTVGYCRVSTSSQKEDLEQQISVVSRYCEANGWKYRILKDVGSGLNYRRKGFQNLIEAVCSGNVERVVVNYKDRLMRFGYEMFEETCAMHDVEIEIVNVTDDVSAEDELVQDVLSVITVFSARLYGKRSHRNKRIVEENRKLFSEGVNANAEKATQQA